METVKTAADAAQYLTFRLVGEEYGIQLLQVKEIIEYQRPTQVPGVPAAIRGVINLRGSVVPVIDLAVKFGLPAAEVTRQTCIVIVEVMLEGAATVMGIVTDAVSEVMDLTPEQVEGTPSFGVKVNLDFLKGLGKVGQRFVLILDVDKVLTTEELLAAAALEPAGAEGAPGV